MSRVQVSTREGAVVIEAEAPDGPASRLLLSPDQARRLLFALIQSLPGPTSTVSLFEGETLTTYNPRFEVRMSDTDQVFLGFQPDGFGPFVLQLDRERAEALADTLSSALRRETS